MAIILNIIISFVRYLCLLAANENRIKPINPVTLINTRYKATDSYWTVIYHLSTGPWLLQGQGNDDNGIEELKETTDGKEDSNKKTFCGLRALS